MESIQTDSDLDKVLARHVVAADGCWNWKGSTNQYGYGTAFIRLSGKHVLRGVHRLAYMHWIGPIPEGRIVMHSCDNRRCINPDPLMCGTQAQNLRLASVQGRLMGNTRIEENPLWKDKLRRIGHRWNY